MAPESLKASAAIGSRRRELFLVRCDEHYRRWKRTAASSTSSSRRPWPKLCDITVELVRLNHFQTDVYVRPARLHVTPRIGVKPDGQFSFRHRRCSLRRLSGQLERDCTPGSSPGGASRTRRSRAAPRSAAPTSTACSPRRSASRTVRRSHPPQRERPRLPKAPPATSSWCATAS